MSDQWDQQLKDCIRFLRAADMAEDRALHAVAMYALRCTVRDMEVHLGRTSAKSRSQWQEAQSWIAERG